MAQISDGMEVEIGAKDGELEFRPVLVAEDVAG